MPENDKKALPLDFDSDYSLPGRFEESNTEFREVSSVRPQPKNRGIAIISIAFVVIAIGFFSYYFANQPEIDSRIIQNTLNIDPEQELVIQHNVGKYGSDHVHAAIVVIVDGKQVNFGESHFQLSSKYIHFENHNPYIIHTHATDVPLEMLFSSFGMKITSDCIILKNSDSLNFKTDGFCSNQDQSLIVYVNGKQYDSEISHHVIKKNDRILIFLGDVKSLSKNLAYLESLKIPDTPKKTPQYSENEIFI